MLANADLLKISILYLFWYNIFTEAHCIMIETISSNKTLRFVAAWKIKDLKKVRRIDLD